jgi:hypothetical protein
MLCEVLKPINGPGGDQLLPGTMVDTTGWRWTKQLIEQRKLRPVLAHEESLPETEARIAAVKKRGRPKKEN